MHVLAAFINQRNVIPLELQHHPSNRGNVYRFVLNSDQRLAVGLDGDCFSENIVVEFHLRENFC